MIGKIVSDKAIKQLKDFNNFLKWAEEKDDGLLIDFKEFINLVHKTINEDENK